MQERSGQERLRSQAELEKAGKKVKQIKLYRTLTEFSIHLFRAHRGEA